MICSGSRVGASLTRLLCHDHARRTRGNKRNQASEPEIADFEQKAQYSYHEMDFGRRLIAKFRFNGVFTFLLEPEAIDATNWRAEHALRPAVVTRKVCGGNRSKRGAETHAVLASILRTIQQRQLDAGEIFSGLLPSPGPITARAPH